MEEQFLHYVWKFQKFRDLPLKTTDGQELTVFHPGTHNYDAGPDFSEAKIKIDSIEWAGQVEIHIKSSDWLKHRHQHDAKYDNVILHVVWQHDKDIEVQGQPIPTLEIAEIVDSSILENYKSLSGNLYEIACSDQIIDINDLKIHSTLTRMVSERLEAKGRGVVEPLLTATQNNWEQVAFIMLARSLGMKTNSESFEALAKGLPINILLKHQHTPKQIEALIFGCGGFLDTVPVDDYHDQLKSEYDFLKHKYELATTPRRANWKFSKLRPPNFPTVRLAQLSAIVAESRGIFSWMLESENVEEVKKKLGVKVSDYWLTHYDFGKKGTTTKSIGNTTINSIIINGLVPVISKYGNNQGDETLLEKALNWLEQLPSEDNKITRKWSKIMAPQKDAFGTQGQIHLFNEYCTKRRCLHCEIGSAIVGR